jgi:hypothetical protein
MSMSEECQSASRSELRTSGASAATETKLYSFPQGTQPIAGLRRDDAGNLFGVTRTGGAFDQGVVYELSPPPAGKTRWKYKALHDFTGGADGGQPSGPVERLADGSLVGTTQAGGQANLGTFFKLSPPTKGAKSKIWGETVLHDFAGTGGNPEGALPTGALLPTGNGGFYGVTFQGGSQNCGMAYRIEPTAGGSTWTETPLADLSCNVQGYSGQAGGGLVADRAGNLYGVLRVGGTRNLGTIYRLAPPNSPGAPWSMTTLFDFSVSMDVIYGIAPDGELSIDENGLLYGAANEGGFEKGNNGTAFALSPPQDGSGNWMPSVLYTFGDKTAVPTGGLTPDGIGGFDGTTQYSLGSAGCGNVFHLAPVAGGQWARQLTTTFSCEKDGGRPMGRLLRANGALYGVNRGYTSPGSVFAVRP